jgi:hypothetical protein
MKIKRFFESINYSTIENYFSDLEDRYDDAILEITEINPNYFRIEVAPSEKIRKQLALRDTSPLSIINRIKVSNKWQNECLEFIERGIVALNNSDGIEKISFHEKNGVFNILVNTTIEGETPEDWIKVDNEGYMEYDEILLKRIMKEKFDVDLIGSTFDKDSDENYMLLMFKLGYPKSLTEEDKESIKRYMLSLSATIYGQNRKIFQNEPYSRDSRMSFFFNRLIHQN